MGPCESCAPVAREHQPPQRRHRYELVSEGFSDTRQGVGAGAPVNVGLRVPELGGILYRFLLVTLDLAPRSEIVAVREGVRIGVLGGLNDGGAFTPWPTGRPMQPYVCDVKTPGWSLPDASWTFAMTASPLPTSARVTAYPADRDTLACGDAGASALLYDTITIPDAATQPGYLGLSAYNAPGRMGSLLFEHHGIHYPWTPMPAGLRQFQYRADVPTRIWFYCDVFQGLKSRTIIALPTAQQTSTFAAGYSREDLFLNLNPQSLVYDVRGGLTVETMR